MANTGRVEKKQRDINPNSDTFGDVRWVDAGYSDLTACPLPAVYRSAPITELVTKNNCPPGQYGSAVSFTLGYGAYTSSASQADADQQARTAFDAQKQTYANANGSCSSSPQQAEDNPVYHVSGLYLGCFKCQMVSQNDPSAIRNATEAEAELYYVPFNTAGTVSCPTCYDPV